MLERLASAFPFLLLATLAALTFWLNLVVQPLAPAADPAKRHDPDYIVDQLSAAHTDTDGRTAYTLAAKRMMHYPDDDTTLLTEPHFVSYRSVQAPVTITAREALVSHDGKDVYFHNDVEVVRAAYADRSRMTLRTAYLHVIPDSHIAKTDRPVTITDAATVVDAVGLEMNNETRILKLLSNVRGTYDPNKAPDRRRKR